MSALFRQLTRGAPRLFKQVGAGLNTFGRQVVNTTRQVSEGLGNAQKFVSDVEKNNALGAIPVVGGVVQGAAGTLGKALQAANTASNAVGQAGSGLRSASAGRFDDAAKSFARAGTGLSTAVNQGERVFL